MIRNAVLAMAFGLLSCVMASAEDDAIEIKLSASKKAYDKAIEKSRDSLVAKLKEKVDAAEKAGNLKLLEQFEAEVKALDDKGELPKSTSTKEYERQVRLAKAAMEDAYAVAVRDYTKATKRAQAKVIQEELDVFKSGKSTPANDQFQKGTVWKGEGSLNATSTFDVTLTVLSRKDNNFTAEFVITTPTKHNRHITGKIENGVISWLGKDVKVNGQGHEGHDHKGKISGNRIVLDYAGVAKKGGAPVSGKVVLVQQGA